MASQEHYRLCLRAATFLRNNGFHVAFDDRFQPPTGTGEQPDAMGFKNGASCLIEVKVSRSDFLKDRKKHFRVDPESGMGDWRFFLCPPNLISPDELPEGWGLLFAHEKIIKKIHGYPESNSCWTYNKPFSANKQAECDYLYNVARRIQIKGYLDLVYEKLE
ncbi:hypothetical protein [Photobacterium kishitanii]|uniref:hypothetical protein n=1 Tax=Photobacterium kishitanii TaxID=318456 RepID=UPI001960595D|nr:hypothetical protein [Photobacterium kishitanii]